MSFPWGIARPPERGTGRAPWLAVPKRKRLSVLIALALGSGMLYPVQPARAAPPVTPPPVNALPVAPTTGFVSSGTVQAPATVGNTMTITQQSQKAILNWPSFNVGSNASVIFDQLQGTSSETLNRVTASTAPSLIFGKIVAPGRVYIINQNGVVFGSTLQIDARGVIASALDISDDKFLNGWDSGTNANVPGGGNSLLVFQWNGTDARFDNTWVQVLPGAKINTPSGGQVILMAPHVINQGEINTPQGQAILAAGAKVYLQFSDDPSMRGMLVEVDPLQPADGSAPVHGEVINDVLGRIKADEGNVTLVGYTVKQFGTVEATTSVRLNGSIYLKAQDGGVANLAEYDESSKQWKLRGAQNAGQLTVGNGTDPSVTRVVPVASADISTDGQGFQKSVIQMSGGQIAVNNNSLVQATGGNIGITTETARGSNFSLDDLTADVSKYIDIRDGAILDASGTQNVSVSVSRNFIQVTPYSSELKDVPPQPNGFLYRQPVWIDLRRMPKVADFSGYASQVERTVDERTATGGSISFVTRGAVNLGAGSLLNVSGGSINYQGGYGKTTQLVSGGKVYDIGDAPPGLNYDGLANVYTQHINKWNVTRTWGGTSTGGTVLTASERYYAGYVEGKDAGTISIVASQATLNGRMDGHVTEGPDQRDAATMARAGQFVLGNISSATGHFWTPNVSFSTDPAVTPVDTVNLSTSQLSQAGFGSVTVASDGVVTLPEHVVLNVQPGGSVTIKAEQIKVDGRISAPGGSIALATKVNTSGHGNSLSTHLLKIGPSALLTARGLWTNDLPGVGGNTFEPVFTNGGQVTLSSLSDLDVAAGSLIDASGGGWVNVAGKLQGGVGGTIALKTGDNGASDTQRRTSGLELDGTVQAYGISGGGTLNLDVAQGQIGGAPNTDPMVLNLAESFFQHGGFAKYNIKTRDGLTVAPGAIVRPQVTALQVDGSYRSRASGADIFDFTQRVLPIVADRTAAQLGLEASNVNFGNLVVGQGASIATDIGGAIRLSAGREIVVDGTLDAPAGTIALTLNGGGSNQPGYYGNQYIWLGTNSRLSAQGAVKTWLTDSGLNIGDVLSGGQIQISAVNGYIITQAGSVLDVSGTSGRVDSVSQGGASTTVQTRLLASDAGSISLTAQEGMLLDGGYRAFAGGDSARGGSLGVELTKPGGTGFPSGPRTIEVRNSGGVVPGSMHVGDTVESAGIQNGYARLALNALPNGKLADGFDRLSLRSYDRIEFSQSTTLTLGQRLLLDAPVIQAALNSTVELNAPYVMLGNTQADIGIVIHPGVTGPTAGSGELDVNAQLVDLVGDLALQNVGKVTVSADGDIRLRATPSQPTLTTVAYTGRFDTAGDLNLIANQVYPTTLSDFTINAGGTVTVAPFSPSVGGNPVLAAGGHVTINAPVIEQRGVLKAPFGEIDLDAATSLHLAPHSVTSVSGEGLVVPVGYTEPGSGGWFYDIGTVNSTPLRLQFGSEPGQVAPPQKLVRLKAPDFTMDAGAQVNISGGGEMTAYQYTPGPPGRSIDILDPAARKSAETDPGASAVVKASAAAYDGTYAIVPGLSGAFAPYDQQAYSATGAPLPGSSVYLSGIPGLLDAGTYALLPARYALLPGAFLVKSVSGYQDMTANQRIVQPDGSYITSGYFANVTATGMAQDARTSGFQVQTGASVRNQVDYGSGTLASWYAANGAWQTAADAGRLVIDAARTLNLNGSLVGTPGAGGQGSQVDILATNIEITSGNTAPSANAVQIKAQTLTDLHAASLLIGGERRNTGAGVEVDVGATNLTVANDANSALVAPEIMLVASQNLTVNAGSVVKASGTATLSAVPITLSGGDPNTPGQSAFLRLASGAQVGVLRTHDRDPSGLDTGTIGNGIGTLKIGAGAQLIAESSPGSGLSSAILDATHDMTNAGTLTIGSASAPGDLAVGANRITLGDLPAGASTSGLVLGGGDLARLNGLRTLDLRSYSGIDFYDDVNLSVNRNLSLEAGRLNGYGTAGQTASVHAGQNLRLSNPNGVVDTSATTGTVGALDLSAGTDLTLGAASAVPNSGGTTVSGFQTVTLSAGRDLVVDGKGSLTVAGDLALNARRVTGRTGADYTIAAQDATNAWHPVTLGAPATPWSGNLPALADVAARLKIQGSRVTDGGFIQLPAGQLQLFAMGAGAGDNVEILNDAGIVAQGVAKQFDTRFVTAPGGSVTLSSASGDVIVDDSASIDVSGVSGGDAGNISVHAAHGAFTLRGQLSGHAPALAGQSDNPAGGSFSVDAGSIADYTPPGGATTSGFSHLNATLESGGFTGKRYVRVRTGDLLLGNSETIQAHDVQLVSDTGAIDIAGRIDAGGTQAGRIALWSAGPLSVRSGTTLDTHATGVDRRGGSVLLATQDSATGINIETGASINVSGTGSQVNSGDVTLRAPRVNGGIAIAGLHGTVIGTKQIVAEAYQVYTPLPTDGDLSVTINRALTDAASFMANASAVTATQALQNQLLAANPSFSAASFHFRPGIEIDSAGDLNLASNVNLLTQRFGLSSNEPGVLTVRTSGQLSLNASLSDGFSDPTAANGRLQSGNSWSYRLVAGADTSSANANAVQSKGTLAPGIGNMMLANGTLIRTGTGNIDIATGGDIRLGSSAVIYTAGQPDVTPLGNFVAPASKYLPVYPLNGGDLSLWAQGNITSAQPTTNGIPYQQIVTDWLWRFGNFTATSNQSYLTWWPRFDLFQQGVAAFGGGTVRVAAGGNLENLNVALPTNGRLPDVASHDNTVTITPDRANLRVLGGGDMTVTAGGDIRSGVFYLGAGTGSIAAQGSLTSDINVTTNTSSILPLYPVLALGEGQLSVGAGGSLTVETVLNPTVFLVNPANLFKTGTSVQTSLLSNFYTYGADSAISLTALTGDVVLKNDMTPIQYSSARLFTARGLYNPTTYLPLEVYPSILHAASLLGDVAVEGSFALYPSAHGQLELLAGNSVTILNPITMPDFWPETSATLPGLSSPQSTIPSVAQLFQTPIGYNFHSVNAAGTLLHAGDPEPIRIVALTGDVVGNLNGIGYFPKPAVIEAGRDLIDIGFFGQNLAVSDVTRIQAGRDLRFSTPTDAQGALQTYPWGIFVGGPGRVETSAGRNVDLGSSKGILSEGNLNNPYLPEGGATLLVLAGSAPVYDNYSVFLAHYLQGGCAAGQASYMCDLQAMMRARTGNNTLTDVEALAQFNLLRPDQQTAFVNHVLYSELKQAGTDATNPDSPMFGNYQRGYDAIARLFPTGTSGAGGNINLYYSQIKTEQGGDIELLAPRGQVNAGLPTLSAGFRKTAAELGIVTVQGGAIRSMTRDDFLVNSQRVFTLQGGDIMLWSSEGNIDAGRGAKTASATPPPRLRRRSDGTVVLDLTQSIAGSGIAALRANPDVEPGNVDLIAPRGTVNAGEAGIRALANLNIAAQQVSGADNIQVGGHSTGLPVADTSGASAAAAASATAGTGKSSDDAMRNIDAMADNDVANIDVEVLGFGDNERQK